MKQIIIEFNDVFVSINQQYTFARFGRTRMERILLTPMARVYKEAVGWEAKKVYRGKPIEGPVKVSIWYWFPNKRRRDIQNDKLTLDGLADGGIYKDDSQIHELHLYKEYSKNKPKTRIIVEKLGPK